MKDESVLFGLELIKVFEGVIEDYDRQCLNDKNIGYDFAKINELAEENINRVMLTIEILWQQRFMDLGIVKNDDTVPVNYLRAAFTPEELENKYMFRFFTRYAIFAQDFVFDNIFSDRSDRLFIKIKSDEYGFDKDVYIMNIGVEPKTTRTFSLDFIFGIFSMAMRKHILTR